MEGDAGIGRGRKSSGNGGTRNGSHRQRTAGSTITRTFTATIIAVLIACQCTLVIALQRCLPETAV
jgi:hypothetical protein